MSEIDEVIEVLQCTLETEVMNQSARGAITGAVNVLAAARSQAGWLTAPMTTSAWEFCCDWYRPDEIERSIAESFWRPSALASRPPENVRSREFAEWLCGQYRLAMNKGIQVGKSQADSSLAAENAKLKEQLAAWDEWAKDFMAENKIPYSGNRGYDIKAWVTGLENENIALTEVMHWAQAALTALNCGDLQRESPLHQKLRQVLIEYRVNIAPAAEGDGE